MKDSRVAIRYAKALFDLCLEQNLLDRVDQDMRLIGLLYKENRDFRIFLKSPIISQSKKKDVLKGLLGDSVHTLTLSFANLMVKQNREDLIAAVAIAFHGLFKKEKGIISVELVSAEALSDQLRSDIVKVLRQESGNEVELTEKVDASLIGGFVMQVEDRQFDASILTKIKRLHREFNVNVYEKGF
jgi:F-type H+-transporting ATPase subunit delta